MSTKVKTVTASPAEIAKQIADKAAGELATLETTLTSLQEQDTQLRQEREQILLEQERRADHLLSLKNAVTKFEQAHKDARDYASVASGTLGEGEAVQQVKECELTLAQARADVAQVEGPYGEQGLAASARLVQIDETLQRLHQEARQAQERRADVERVKDRAVGELGEHTYQGLLAEYEEHQKKIEAARQVVLDLQVQKAHFLDQAQATLSPWPGLARKFKSEESYEDPTSRILTAARDYVERLVEDGPQVANSIPVPAVNFANGNNWLVLLEVPRDDLFINEHVSLGKRHRGLTQRLHILNELLSQYVASKR